MTRLTDAQIADLFRVPSDMTNPYERMRFIRDSILAAQPAPDAPESKPKLTSHQQYWVDGGPIRTQRQSGEQK